MFSVSQDFKMHVDAGATTAGAHQGDNFPFFNLLTDRNQVLAIMSVARGISIAMTDFHKVAIAVALSGPDHNSRS